MATEIICQVCPGGLRAVSVIEAEKLEPIMYREVMCKISQPRNLQFHKRYFAFLGVTLSMIDEEYTLEQLRAIVTVGMGHCDFIEADGKLVAIPKSISFAAEDQTSFERIMQDSVTFVCKRWVIDENQLNAILEFM